MEIKIISQRYKGKGKLFHYSHFVRDLIIPLFEFSLHFDNSIDVIYVSEARLQTCGTFIKKLKEFFDIPCYSISEEAFEASPAMPVYLQCLQNKPVVDFVYQNLLQYIELKYELLPHPPTYVTMIERGKDRLVFNEANGAKRRHIVNHDEITRVFSDVPEFRSVALEDMSFYDQIELFYNSKVIIAQHGAALINTIFSRGAHVFEIIAGKMDKWYGPIRDYKTDLTWHQINFPNSKFNRLYVPPKKLLSLVRPYL